MRTITARMNRREREQYAEIQRQLARCPTDKRWYWEQMLSKLLRQTNQQGAQQ